MFKYKVYTVMLVLTHVWSDAFYILVLLFMLL